MPAGAVAYTTPDGKPGILYCSQGDFSTPSGLFQMCPGKPPEPVLTNSFGTEFGTICAVAVQKNGNTRPVGNGDALWFVDAGARGFRAGFRPRPAMPPMVWRFVPKTGDLRAMTDDVKCPWGIALAPDGQTVYVTDSEPVGDDGPENM
jgi:gluconolactonase